MRGRNDRRGVRWNWCCVSSRRMLGGMERTWQEWEGEWWTRVAVVVGCGVAPGPQQARSMLYEERGKARAWRPGGGWWESRVGLSTRKSGAPWLRRVARQAATVNVMVRDGLRSCAVIGVVCGVEAGQNKGQARAQGADMACGVFRRSRGGGGGEG